MIIAVCRPENRKLPLHLWGAAGLLLMLLLIVLSWQAYCLVTRVSVAAVSDPLGQLPFIWLNTNTGEWAPVVRSVVLTQARYEPTPEAIPAVHGTAGPGSHISVEEEHNASVK